MVSDGAMARYRAIGVTSRRALLVLAMLLIVSEPGFAADPPSQRVVEENQSEPLQPPQPLDEALRETAERVVTALRLLLMAIPQYEAPEILGNGDILIRRRRPEPVPAPQDEPMGEAYQRDL